MTFNEVMTNIANKIRDALGLSEKIRLTDIPGYIDVVWDQAYFYGEEDGYWNGYDIGYGEGDNYGYDRGYDDGVGVGQKAEYDRFWDAYQDYGKRTPYPYAFAGYCWTDETYNPKYPINATGNANALFLASAITDTKVPINLGTTTLNKAGMFESATNLVTIRELIWDCDINFANQFSNCVKLKNITFNGTITRNINMQWCPLTPESAWNVVQHLKIFDMDDGEGNINPDFMKYTITFSASVWEVLDEYTKENELHGWGTVRDMIENEIGWRTA